jgi:hypothetical protein
MDSRAALRRPCAFAELRRVLRPGGDLRLYERVLSGKPAPRLSQRAVGRAFSPRAFGGCRTARETLASIETAGFEIEDQHRIRGNPVPVAFRVGTHTIGRACRSGSSPSAESGASAGCGAVEP